MARDGGSSPQVRRGTASITRRSYRQPLECLLGITLIFDSIILFFRFNSIFLSITRHQFFISFRLYDSNFRLDDTVFDSMIPVFDSTAIIFFYSRIPVFDSMTFFSDLMTLVFDPNICFFNSCLHISYSITLIFL